MQQKIAVLQNVFYMRMQERLSEIDAFSMRGIFYSQFQFVQIKVYWKQTYMGFRCVYLKEIYF